ncbi:DUF2840 domain-containing protein [Pararhizobium mangrovi]|uniref:DUF2840 domain-containing protein n=1 Tax=Pararhizobium mangrovi TaxID=2590452 RepID=A0A506U2X9_9HYPH|nr:DUF2840 domain-containing protein [Pararhizobium mangrovi]TPW27706.1 DUF2840 domain-containing protein [Pararhizobium mangrovi]
MSGHTTVELLWIEKRIERWIRFGRIAQDTILDRRRRIVGFDAGSVFAYVRWAANDYGTVVSRIDILRAVPSGEAYATVPYVTPGADILLRQAGWPKVDAVLEAIDRIEAIGVAPEDVCPDHWRHLHHRITARQQARPYTLARHAAWCKRRNIEP